MAETRTRRSPGGRSEWRGGPAAATRTAVVLIVEVGVLFVLF